MTRRIDAFKTAATMNYHDTHEEREAWSNWMRNAYYPPEETAPQCGKRVLGRQDYCVDLSYRNWVWERPFEVEISPGRVETWRWRLFASRRGFTLEVEDKYDRPFGKTIRIASKAAMIDFYRVWNKGVLEKLGEAADGTG